jgi:NAD-dependent deacetylase
MAGPLVAILSGAGISTESGIPDYRGPNGLWRRDPEAEKLATYEYYMGDPEIRRRSWQARRAIWALRPEPNAAHRAIADLDRSGMPVRVITQNVDGLHQRAGMPERKVLELHGTTQDVVCTACGARTPARDVLPRLEAGLVAIAGDGGARLVIVNAEPTPYDDVAHEVIREPIGTALPQLLASLRARP